MNTSVAKQLSDVGVEAYLEQQQEKSLLRFLTCGSVDDGKSTLIGRLLHDSQQIYDDQLAALKNDSEKMGTTGDAVDLALLVDGLQAEREQGITIDVAYRYFSTDKRKFIIADTPGHEQYTRNMATGASTCDLAVILIDARYGVQVQTRRHSFIASLLGIKHFVVAINKMDLVDYDQQVFEQIRADYQAFVDGLGERTIDFVPLSALNGDNVVNASEQMPWYGGETLLNLLERAELAQDDDALPARLPVQYVNRPHLDFRGFCGTLAAGTLAVGDSVTALPSGKSSLVKSIVTYEGELPSAVTGQAITVTLEDEIDVSRGDMLVASDNKPFQARGAQAKVVWMGEQPMQPGQQYDLKLASKKNRATVTALEHRIDVNTLETQAVDALALNEVGQVTLSFAEPLVFDAYASIRDTGGFILIDRLTNVTVAAGMIASAVESEGAKQQFSEFELEFNALVRKHFPHWQAVDISQL